jgi:hypothetical protein
VIAIGGRALKTVPSSYPASLVSLGAPLSILDLCSVYEPVFNPSARLSTSGASLSEQAPARLTRGNCGNRRR